MGFVMLQNGFLKLSQHIACAHQSVGTDLSLAVLMCSKVRSCICLISSYLEEYIPSCNMLNYKNNTLRKSYKVILKMRHPKISTWSNS